jgi:prepilin signal peptidase PulO-like enzyme (type II secretory pathway)
MEIDNWLSLSILLFLLSINLLLFFNGYKENALIISEKFSYFPYENLSLALMLGLIFLIIVLITKEKALGGGDIRLAIITGLLIGNSNSLPWLYITVFSAITYGLVIGYKKGSLKNLKIPFTPFMILGATVSLLIDMFF